MNKHMMKFLALLLVWLGSVTGVHAAGEAAVYYIQTDQLNTPRVITDQSQAVVWKWESEGFGSAPPNEQPGAAPAFVFNPRFAGQYFDWESNLHYNYFRDYDPAIGRYIQSDPIGLDGGINTYAYVVSDPISNTDPNGLNPAFAIARAGRIGWNIGQAINPTVQPYIAAALAGIFGDPTALPDNVSASKEQGRNYITQQARTEAKAMGMDPCDYYKWLKEQPGYKGNSQKIKDIEKAEKFDGCRNKQKRKDIYNCEG